MRQISSVVLFIGTTTLLVALQIASFSTTARAAQASPPAAEWTLLFYLDADNDLEAPQMEDLKEMLAVGSTKSVNIVVLADRHPNGKGKYTDEPIANLKDWTTAKLLYVEQNKLRELADWGEVNMGDPATLKRFLQIGTKDFPAKHYSVIFGDHGMAWPGACADESNGDDSLTSQEIPLGLSEVSPAIGKFEIIGFDACLMANLEVAKAMAPYGRVMVASEELEPGDGWNYTPLLETLTKSPKMTGVDLGRAIVNTYNDYFTKADDAETRGEGSGITLSVIALDRITSLEKAVNDLAVLGETALNQKGREAWLKFAEARSQSEEYGKSSDTKGEPGSGVHDLIHFAQNVKQLPTDTKTAQAADAVIKATRDVVIHQIHGQGRPNANGLSIFFPPDGETLLEKDQIAYGETAFAIIDEWFPFLKLYTGVEAKDKQLPELEAVASSDTSVDKDDVTTVTARVKGDDIESSSFVLAISENSEQVIIGAIPAKPDNNGGLKEEWDGQWFTLGDKHKEVTCPITDFEELDDAKDLYWAEVPAQVRLKDTSEWLDVTLYFTVDFNGEAVTGDLIYAFEDGRFGPREISLDVGDELRPVYLSIDVKGEEHLIASDDADDILHIEDGDDIKIGRQDVAPGKYLLGFVVSDYANNRNEQFVEVTIK